MTFQAPACCKRCGIEFEPNNQPVECSDCDRPTLCLACADDERLGQELPEDFALEPGGAQ